MILWCFIAQMLQLFIKIGIILVTNHQLIDIFRIYFLKLFITIKYEWNILYQIKIIFSFSSFNAFRSIVSNFSLTLSGFVCFYSLCFWAWNIICAHWFQKYKLSSIKNSFHDNYYVNIIFIQTSHTHVYLPINKKQVSMYLKLYLL